MQKLLPPKNNFRRMVGLLIIVVLIFIYIDVYFIFTPTIREISGVKNLSASENLSVKVQASSTPQESISHIATPPTVKAIYMSACSASVPTLRSDLVNLIDTTELNAVVLDIKDFTGMLSFMPDNPELAHYTSTKCYVHDMKDFIATLHSKGIYVIGRVTTFQDPYFTKLHPETAIKSISMGGSWKDINGLSYIDPASHEAWNHVVAIATSSYAIGFDEINFDYIRYPSDGNLIDMGLPESEGSSKAEVIESFFSYLHDTLHPLGIKMSADLFGMVTTNYDDLGIGQVLERAMPYFDYIDPMVYPSHYPATFHGWENPNAYPYDLIKYVMSSAVARAIATSSKIKILGSEPISSTSPPLFTKVSYDQNKMRPWLQDFTLGQPIYTADMVRAQIQGVYDVGLDSWLLWNAGNHYTKDALRSQ